MYCLPQKHSTVMKTWRDGGGADGGKDTQIDCKQHANADAAGRQRWLNPSWHLDCLHRAYLGGDLRN